MDYEDQDQLEIRVEDDELNSWEEGFLRGYEEETKNTLEDEE